jgi:amidohydrolase
MDVSLLKRIEGQTRELRKNLHRFPEMSNHEEQTARTIISALGETDPSEIINGLGGHGVAAVFDSGHDGPTVMFRAELDALPIEDEIDKDYKSHNPGAGHKCGHDGHMAVITGLGTYFKNHPPERGRAVLLYQPAEETGEGAGRVMQDEKFESVRPDYIFAFHNIPGYKENEVIVRDDVFAAASRGYITRLKGATSHAAHPEQGRNPAFALSELIRALALLPEGVIAGGEYALVTLIHARLGERDFGTSAGYAELMATFRSYSESVMDQLVEEAERITNKSGSLHGLTTSTEWTEVFPATVNDKQAVDLVRRAADIHQIGIIEKEKPFPWSEDFGRFSGIAKGALFGIGAGVKYSELHSASYDFPDEIILSALKLFVSIYERLLLND